LASPTVLDALVIELGLDASKFRTGADDAERGTRKAKDETEKGAKDIQKAVGEGIAGAFQTATRRALEFFAVLAGARSLEQFAVSVTQSATQLGIMANVIGMPVDRLSAFGLAVERAGGNANSAIQSLQHVKDKMTEIAVSGGSVPIEWQRLGVDVRSAQNPEELLNRTLDAMKSSSYGRTLTQSQKIAMLRWLGVDDGTANFLVTRGSAGEKSAVAAAEKDAVTPAQVVAATRITDAWNGAAQAVRSVGREVMRTVAPAFEALLQRVRELIEANKGAIQDWLGTNIKDAVKWLTDPATWKGAKDVLDDIYKKVNAVAEATGGWGNLTATLVGLWAVGKINPIIMSVGLLTMAFRDLASSLLFAEGGLLVKALGALAVGALIPRFRHWMETPETDEDELKGARSKLKLMGNANPTDEDIRKMVQYDKQPWWGRIITTPDSLDASLRRHKTGLYAEDKPISTAEGPVSEGRPLPVKIVGGETNPTPSSAPPSADPTPTTPDAAPAPEGILHKVWRTLTGTPATPPAPIQPNTPLPSTVHAPLQLPGAQPATPVGTPAGRYNDGTPSDHKLPPAHFHITDPDNPPNAPYNYTYPAPGEKSGFLGGSAVYASGQAQRVSIAQRGTSSVTIQALNLHTGALATASKDDYYRKHIKADFYAMKSDVGLA
jgi:hypothetical protein